MHAAGLQRGLLLLSFHTLGMPEQTERYRLNDLVIYCCYLVIQVQNLTQILKKKDHFEVNCILFLNQFPVLKQVKIVSEK